MADQERGLIRILQLIADTPSASRILERVKKGDSASAIAKDLENAARNAAIWYAYLAGDKLNDIATRYGFTDRADPDRIIKREAERLGIERPRRKRSKRS